MDNPLHAAHYADQAGQYQVVVSDRRRLARDTYLMRLDCGDLARIIAPGQFIMIRWPRGDDPLLGRAFALYDVAHQDGIARSVDVVFHTVGKVTELLSGISPGESLSVWGPLGNGFAAESAEHLIMVAGGIGQTPFLALAKETLGIQRYADRNPGSTKQVSLCYGARSADLLAGIDDFQSAGVDVHLATDDGSVGHHGLVSEVLGQVLENSRLTPVVVCCGPEPMLEAVSTLCVNSDVHCQVSLETPMACGLGICFSCVTRVRQPEGGWDYKRTCVDGPVFDARELAW